MTDDDALFADDVVVLFHLPGFYFIVLKKNDLLTNSRLSVDVFVSLCLCFFVSLLLAQHPVSWQPSKEGDHQIGRITLSKRSAAMPKEAGTMLGLKVSVGGARAETRGTLGMCVCVFNVQREVVRPRVCVCVCPSRWWAAGSRSRGGWGPSSPR